MIILAVDDEEGVRRSLRRALEKEDWQVLMAENGDQALDIVRSDRLDIEAVISDFKMPGMNGLETLVEIGRINPEITRIMLTGYATMDSAIESVNAGIDGFLTKPFDNTELRAKIREYILKKRLKQFVSEQVYSEMQQTGGNLLPGRRKVTILFADIRGFSFMAERLSPEELTDLMNKSFYTPLDDVICTGNGMLDKHIGDSVMGVFGAPLSYDNDAERAVISAIRARETLAAINGCYEDETRHISVGIGIATGEVQAGFFGSSRKKEYTVMGTPVILAARLESLAEKGQILVCEETYRQIRHFVSARKIELTLLKGVERRIAVYEVLGTINVTGPKEATRTC
ncbi:MAG: adenylate/guanylate cyclase domain-containing protein [Syntrophales bacterium]|jgi:class 3 adenylate cyclase|nr:adenylate/guanylate cyclase domain-containing protein [Syntrophales bacterium]